MQDENIVWVKSVAAILSPYPIPEPSFYLDLEKKFGAIIFKGPMLVFDTTPYYHEEFGPQLYRGFLAFEGLMQPKSLVHNKLLAHDLEATWSHENRRVYNIDMGYLDFDKLVLASFKRGPCKLYLEDGVYADMLVKYSKGQFEAFPWAFTDFKDGRYQKSLLTIREKLKAETRKHL
jgi:hypothetical protein